MQTASMLSERHQRSVLFITVLLSLIAGSSLIFRTPGAEQLSSLQALLPVLATAVAASFALYWPVRWLAKAMRPLSRRTIALALCGAFLAGLLWTWLLPVRPAPDNQLDIAVAALGTKSPQAVSSEVWVRLEVDGKNVSPSTFKQSGDWIINGEFLVSAAGKQPTVAEWHGSYAQTARLVFVSHSWSGQARVQWGDQTRELDLYAPEGSSRSIHLGGIEQTDHVLSYPDRNARQFWVQLCDSALVGLLLLLAYFALSQRAGQPAPARVGNPGLLRESLWHALPLVVIGTLLIGIFYPALMTSDSLDQWRQSGSGQFNDAHPILYGFFLLAVRWVHGGAALAAFVQLLLFAAASGWLIASIRQAMQAPRWVGHASAVLLALYPLVSLTAVTLWKDVPYSAAVIALCALLIDKSFGNARNALSWGGAAGLAALVFACMALRHNGPAVSVAAILVLWFALPGSRKRVLLAAIVAIAGLLLLKGPITDLAGASRGTVSFIPYSHHLAAHLAAGHTPTDPAEAALLHQINGTDADWAYNCATVNPIVFNKNYNSALAAANSGALFDIWAKLAMARPDIEIDHLACSSALIWHVTDSPFDPLYLSGVGLWAPHGEVSWITGLPGDPVPDSMSPPLAQWFGTLVLQPDMQVYLRPAAFLLALAFAAVVGWSRRRDWHVLVVMALPLAHTGFLAISIVAQDARYQLPIYVVALACIPSLLAAARRPSHVPLEASTPA
ncbi:hypothetical protein D3C71_868140 [compost metagenome]|nr:hypothetical protein [Stenotrophomonas humi]